MSASGQRLSGVNYNVVSDRRIEDKRFERERVAKLNQPNTNNNTIDVLVRLATGGESKKIADKIADPNRPSWEQYKKEKEIQLGLCDVEEQEMAAYRAELDREREKRLQNGINRTKRPASSDSSDSSDSDSQDKKHKKDKKKSKKSKHKKDKKDKKRSSREEDDSDRHSSKKNKSSSGSYKLSDFMRADDY